MQSFDKLEQNDARECSSPVSQFIKTLVTTPGNLIDVNTAPKLSSVKRWEVEVLNKSLEIVTIIMHIRIQA